jgi:uncharacterized protein
VPPKRTIEGARKPPWLHAALVLYADVDVGTDTAIFAAIRNNDITRLKTLLGAGANANARGERGVPALMYARAYGSLNAVKLLLDAGADVNSSGGLGATALMWSVTEPEKVALLVSRGRCQAKSKMGRTALLLAALHNGYDRVVDFLLRFEGGGYTRDGRSRAYFSRCSVGSV